MNDFTRARRDCIVGVKAWQNLRASAAALDRLCSIIEAEDIVLLNSVFYMAIVRYAKPFIKSKLSTGFISYPTKTLKKAAGFSALMHAHILQLRDTLIAHDDFDEIEPKLLLAGFSPHGQDIHIPVWVVISNKCISHPAELEGAIKLKQHVQVTLNAVQEKLHDDMGKLRKIAIDHPELTATSLEYSNNHGTQEVPIGGIRLTPPDFGKEPFLDLQEPTFPEVQNGYRYEWAKLKREFYGPERITLPNGDSFEISP